MWEYSPILAPILMISAFVAFAINRAQKDWKVKKFKEIFLPTLREFEEKYPSYSLQAIDGTTIGLIREGKLLGPFIMWSPQQNFNTTLKEITSNILEPFSIPGGYLYSKIYNSAFSSSGGLSKDMRKGLILAIQEHAEEKADQKKRHAFKL